MKILISQRTNQNIEVFFWGLARVTSRDHDEWVDWFRIQMFPTSQDEYRFLTRHLWRNWWWINSSSRKALLKNQRPGFRLHSCLVEIPSWELDHLKRNQAMTRVQRRDLAERCFQGIINALKQVTGDTIKRQEVIARLEELKSECAASIVKEFDNDI